MKEVIKHEGDVFLNSNGLMVRDLISASETAVALLGHIEDHHWDEHVTPLLQGDPEFRRLRMEFHEAMKIAAASIKFAHAEAHKKD